MNQQVRQISILLEKVARKKEFDNIALIFQLIDMSASMVVVYDGLEFHNKIEA